MPDFGLLQTPNFAASASAGYQAGHALGQQKRLDGALAAFDINRPETAVGVLNVDPETGMGLLRASQAAAAAHRETASREATANWLINSLGLKGGGQASGVTQGGQVSPVNPAATPADGADIVVTARAPTSPHDDQAEIDAIHADPTGYMKTKMDLANIDESHRKAIGDAADAQGSMAIAVSQMPYEARRDYINAHRSDLKAHGVADDQIDSFDPTDQNIHALAMQSMSVKDALGVQDRAADNARQDRNVDSEIASRGLRDSLAVNEDHRSAASRGEAHTRFTERNSGKGGGSAATAAAPERRTVLGGKTYVKVGGKWLAQ